MPSHYSVHLLSIDDPDNPSECNCSATNEVVSDYTIQLTLQWCSNCAIQRHRVYSCVISAMNSAGTSASDTVELSNTIHACSLGWRWWSVKGILDLRQSPEL